MKQTAVNAMDGFLCPGRVIVLDRDAIILRANDAATRAFGDQTAKGACFAHLIHADDKEEFSRCWFEVLEGTSQPSALIRIKNGADSKYQRHAFSATHLAEENEVHAILVPLNDDKPAPSLGIHDPEMILRALLDHCDITISVTEPDGRIAISDGKGLQAAGMTRNQLAGQSMFALYDKELPEEMAKLRKTMKDGDVFEWKVDLLNVYWDTVCMPLRAKDGKILGGMMATVNKSDMKIAMQDLKNKLELIERQQAVIRNLETPIIQVWNKVLTLPMVGIVDSQRAARVMDDLLNMIVNRSARYAILDLTGVDTVDTATASHLIQMVTAIRLLGAEGIISGIRPTVAQTLVTLGVDISAIRTFGSLQDALRHCIRHLMNENTNLNLASV